MFLPAFQQFPELHAGFAGKPVDFRKKTELLTLSKSCLWGDMKQVHGVHFVEAEQTFETIPEADGITSQKKNIACKTLVADCIGGLFYNPKTQEIAAVHAGWKGLAQKIFTKYLSGFSDVSEIHVALSPSLGPCCSEFTNPFSETPSFFHAFVEKRQGKYFVNLWEIAKQELLQCGILLENITMPSCCTKCSPQHWWSHRNGDAERNVAFIYQRNMASIDSGVRATSSD